MALDVSGFVTPEQDFAGLYNLSNKLERRNELQRRQQKEDEARQYASTKFFSNYLDDKAKFTGTQFDPYTHQLTSDALTQAMEMIKQGANDSDVMMAITPLVNRVDQYSSNAQQYAKNKKEQLEMLKNVKGIDLNKVSSEMDRLAFEGKDISAVDPTLNYADQVLRNGDVYNNEGFDEYFKNAKRNTTIEDVQRTNSRGGTVRNKEEISAEHYLQPETNEKGDFVGMVPKFQEITDEGNKIIGQFHTDQGIVNAPIRALSDEVFNDLPKAAKAYSLQEARRYAKEKNIPLSDARVEFLAKAIAYDELKPHQSVTHKVVELDKEPKAPRITIKMPSESAMNTQRSINDLHTALDEEPTDSNGKIDVSKYINGVTFLTNSKGKRISQPNVFYNPKDKTFTYSDDDGNESTVSFSKFKSIATPVNAASDLKFLEGFRNYIRKSNSVQQGKPVKEEKPKGFLSGLRNSIINGIKAVQRSKPAAKQTTTPKKDPLGLFQ